MGTGAIGHMAMGHRWGPCVIDIFLTVTSLCLHGSVQKFNWTQILMYYI